MATERLVGLVTGCSAGFGEVIAHALAEAGHEVFATMRDIAGRNRQTADQLESWARARGHSLTVLEMDVRDADSVHRAVAEVTDRTGRIDVVVNNAGIAAFGPIEAFEIEQMQALFDTNVFGALRVDKAVLPGMRARRSGLLIHITSALGRVIVMGGGLYPASKWAAEGFAEGLHDQLAAFGVDVAIIEPGAFPTEAVPRALQPTDSDITAAYAQVTAEPTPSFSDAPPRLQDIADAVLAIVDSPAAQRPMRTVVGTRLTAGVAELNAHYEVARRTLAASLSVGPDR